MNRVDRSGCTIAFEEAGDASAPAVLFSHSLGLDHRSWEAEAERLAPRFRVVRIDTRGHGRSDVPIGPYRLEELAADVLAVADHLEIDRFHMVGLSLGGLMALWLAAHRPERLLSATYCNTAARLGDDEIWASRIESVSSGMDAIVDQVFPRFFTPSFSEREPDAVARVLEVFLATNPEGYAGCCGALRDADLRPVVGQIRVPSLIIGSQDDVATPPEQSIWLHEAIAGSELVLLADAAHVSNLEQPAAFAEPLMRHLDNSALPRS